MTRTRSDRTNSARVQQRSRATAGAAGSKRSLDEPQNSQEKEKEKEKENANEEKKKEKGTAPPAKKLRVDRRGIKPLTSFFEVKPK